MHSYLLAVMLLLPVVTSSFGYAQSPDPKPVNTVALLSLEIAGDGPPELRQVLQTHIASGLRKNGIDLIPLSQTLDALKEYPELSNCFSDTCLEQIGKLTASQQFVRARVTASGANYELELQLLNAVVNRGIQPSVSDSCKVCTVSELGELISQSAQKLIEPEELARHSTVIETDPDGALISIDGTAAGVSPVKIKLEEGLHKVVALWGNKRRNSKTIKVEADGVPQSFALTPAQVPVVSLATKPATLPVSSVDYGPWKWGSAVLSGGLLIAGGILIPRSHPLSSHDQRDDRVLAYGIGSLSGGILFGAISSWMFWREHSSEKKLQPQKSPLSFQLSGQSIMSSYEISF